MRLLDRYLLRELLLLLGLCLGGFLLFWVAFDVFSKVSELQQAKLTGPDVVAYYLSRTPEILVVILPVALLFALLYTLTQHARNNEITAMRAAGISLWRLALPYFAVGLLLSLVVFGLNELLVPGAADREDEILTRRVRPTSEPRSRNEVRNLGFKNASGGREWNIGSFNLVSGEMRQPKVNWQSADGTKCWLYAARAVFHDGAWTFYDAHEWRQDSATNTMLAPFLQTNTLVKSTFTETPGEIRSEIRVANRMSMGRNKDAEIPVADLLGYLRLHPHPQGKEWTWFYTKLYGRLAAPWTSLVVVLIALPFGAPSGRRNVFAGVASSIFLCFGYFILQQLALACGTGGLLPPWLAAALPHLAFGGTGAWLIARMR
jgi:lipopolysaccharide export system permease protein